MGEPNMTEQEELVAALNAPSFEQDSKWYSPTATYATKPRALLTDAASALQAQAGEISRLKRALEEIAKTADELSGPFVSPLVLIARRTLDGKTGEKS